MSVSASSVSTEPWGPSAFGLYVHVPFCPYKCYYCDFATSPYAPALVQGFLDCVRREAGAYASVSNPLTSIYVGGGTPSLLSAREMHALLRAMRTTFDVEDGAEVTVEVNPETVDASKLAAYRDAGVTRLSIGVQSADDETLAALGRDHTFEQSSLAVATARELGFTSVSIDLIFGLPAQDSQAWASTLAAGLALDPDHISLYGLTVEPKTVFDFMRRRDELRVPSDDEQADMYAAAIDAASGAGYRHYEISNFARPGHESRHNMTYWADEPYVGLGPSACGYVGGRRYGNVRGTKSYMQRVTAGRPVVVDEERLEGIAARSQTLVLGLRRLDGVDRAEYRARHGRDVLDDFATPIAFLQGVGLIDVSEGAVRLTRRGVLLSNEVFVRLLP